MNVQVSRGLHRVVRAGDRFDRGNQGWITLRRLERAHVLQRHSLRLERYDRMKQSDMDVRVYV